MKKIGVVLILFFVQFATAQQDAWVYLADKPNATAALSNPLSILSQKSIDRKALRGVAIDERDVPVETTYITQIKSATGITVMAKSKWFNALHVRGTIANINALLNLPFVTAVVFADASLNARTKSGKNKFKKSETLVTFDYGSASNQATMLNVDFLHDLDYTGEGVTIAVLDAGFPNVNTMSAFQRLRDNGDLLDGYDFVDRTNNVYASTASSHGTMVLSTMAGYLLNQYVGTAPDASYYLFRTEDVASENPVEESYWVEAAEMADSLGVDIINTSLGYTTYDNPNYSYTNADMDGNTAFITRGANIAFEKGILLVTSAGNSGSGSWKIVGAPADASGVFSVGAVDSSGSYAYFSSIGNASQPTQKPDVVARGLSSAVITPSNTVIAASGTSFSSPIMAGAIASFWQINLSKTNAEIMQLVRKSASQYTTPDYLLGYGIPDFSLAYNTILNISGGDKGYRVFPNPTNGNVSILPTLNVGQTVVSIYSILGKNVYRGILGTNHDIDISNLSSGVYIAVIESKSVVNKVKIIKI